MLKLIEEINNALDNGNIRCALGMALTLPDICGQIEYPDETGVGKRYKDWCKNHLFNQGFAPEWIQDESTGERVRERVLDGETCYSLRCAFLHSGNLELKNLCFHLSITSVKENGIYKQQIKKDRLGDIKEIHIDARHLCCVLCNAASEFYNETSDKSLFCDHHVVIEDLEEFFSHQEQEMRERARKTTPDEYEKMISQLSEPARKVYEMIHEGKWDADKDYYLSQPELKKGHDELLAKNMITYNALD